MYTISIGKYMREIEGFENLTVNAFCNDNKKLVEHFNDNGYQDELEGETLEEKAQEIRQLDCFYEMYDSYAPMMNYAHVLSSEPRCRELIDILKHAPNISILYIEDIEAHVISLSGGGMDFSDSIAYAYLKIDGNIPHDLGGLSFFGTVSKHAEESIKEYQGKRD